MPNTRKFFLLSLFSAVIVSSYGLTGCSSGGSATVKANLKLTSNASRVMAAVSDQMESLSLTKKLMPSFRATTAGSNTAAQLASLKYFIGTIAICESMTTSGSAFSNPEGCITVYTGPTESVLNPTDSSSTTPDYAAIAAHAASVTTGYIDLMSETSRADIAAASTAISAGSYNWGYITWAYAIKATATVTAGPTTLYTRSGTTTNVGSSAVTTASSTFVTASAQEAIVTLPNGGTWFKFQNPFVVTATDTDIAVDLTFNPESLIKAFHYTGAGGAGTPSNLSYYDGANDGTHDAMNIPFLDITPVPRRGSSEQTMVETYTAVAAGHAGTTDTFDLRLELYYNSGDTAKSIYGATLRVVPNATTLQATDVQKIAFITAGTGGTLDFNDYDNNPIISGLTRQGSVAGTTTATLPCTGAFTSTSFSPAGCASGSSMTTTFALTSVVTLN